VKRKGDLLAAMEDDLVRNNSGFSMTGRLSLLRREWARPVACVR